MKWSPVGALGGGDTRRWWPVIGTSHCPTQRRSRAPISLPTEMKSVRRAAVAAIEDPPGASVRSGEVERRGGGGDEAGVAGELWRKRSTGLCPLDLVDAAGLRAWRRGRSRGGAGERRKISTTRSSGSAGGECRSCRRYLREIISREPDMTRVSSEIGTGRRLISVEEQKGSSQPQWQCKSCFC